jgi:hypothetical protein
MSAEMLNKLLQAGYAPGQIMSCPLSDPCPCEVAGLQTDCGLSPAPSMTDAQMTNYRTAPRPEDAP